MLLLEHLFRRKQKEPVLFSLFRRVFSLVYFHECPAEPYIPIFLIVGGKSGAFNARDIFCPHWFLEYVETEVFLQTILPLFFSSLHMNTYLKRFIIIWIASVMEGYSTTFLVIIKAYIHTGLTLFFLRVILFMLGAFSVFKYLIGVLTRVRRAETGNEQVRYFLTCNFPIISRSFLRPIDWAVSVGRSVIIS